MKRLFYALSLVGALCLVVGGSTFAWGGIGHERARLTVVKVEPRLRSAFLLREMGTPTEYRYSTVEDLRSQLKTHFDAVLEILEANRERSLAIAMARLEQRQGIVWTLAQQRYWHRYLSEQRDQNIARLTAYRDRGVFPLNEGQNTEGAPIFVDNHDTACAVGHLMRESGWEHEVELIATTNLLVYVTDIRSGPLVNWVLQSGLTLGEAALIQPAYLPPFAEVPLNTISGPGAGFNTSATYFDGTNEVTIADGLRYENFMWRRLQNMVTSGEFEFPPGSGNYVGDPAYYTGDWQTQTPDDIGVRTDYQYVASGDGWVGHGANWPYANMLTWAHYDCGPEGCGFPRALGGGFRAYALSFDVVANHPSLAIDRLDGFLGEWFNSGQIEAWNYVTTPSSSVELVGFPYEPAGQPMIIESSPGSTLASFHTALGLPSSGGGSIDFSPQDRVRVHTYFLLRGDDLSFGAYTYEIRLTAIPEPSCAALACCFAIGLVWRRN